ncbi:MAG: hypothetical protein JSS12_10875, partial [Verrucomicrobia bacterium]|nr:hypothetical protein [Verrucomicrobiota bacterium]
ILQKYTFHAQPCSTAQGEGNTQKAALLGRGIQTVFVDKKDQREIASYLQENELDIVVAAPERIRKAIN